MKKANQAAKRGSKSAAVSQAPNTTDNPSAKPERAGEFPLPQAPEPDDINKLVPSVDTWRIVSANKRELHRTVSGRLIIFDVTGVDLDGRQEYLARQLVSYEEACDLLPSLGCRRNPESVLMFHGISNETGKAVRRATLASLHLADTSSALQCARVSGRVLARLQRCFLSEVKAKGLQVVLGESPFDLFLDGLDGLWGGIQVSLECASGNLSAACEDVGKIIHPAS